MRFPVNVGHDPPDTTFRAKADDLRAAVDGVGDAGEGPGALLGNPALLGLAGDDLGARVAVDRLKPGENWVLLRLRIRSTT
jgi:hypothetical protein